MNPIEILKEEHRDIERELIELETIAEADEINYPNLVHVSKKLCQIWDLHEEKEEIFFPALEEKKIVIPVTKMLCEHKNLREHKEAIQNAIKTASEIEMKHALENHGKIIIEKLREHIDDEDEVLYAIVLDEIDVKELEKVWNSMNL
jgi:hemerythrin-like domain-containing protein